MGELKDPRRGPDRPLSGRLLSARIPALLEELKAEAIWDEERRNARTLFKAEGLRVVLVALKAGGSIARHKVARPITIQVLEGTVRVTAGKEKLSVGPGGILQLAPSVPHSVEADEDAAFMITMGGAA